ncbi:MAG: winged helix-turn-helix transcriptional regulator [Candidatus Marinimicrobia bacterium]|nr:winged helix-turn-helix transcriptional regulator [Candidatus Neomarinimicrobiota bacterium]
MVENAWKVLEQIWLHPKITIKEIAKNIGTSTTTVDKHIAKLKEYRVLERIGGDRGGVWIIPEIENTSGKSYE